jgi:phosphoglycerate dehydrogenase-like enzyme
VTLRVLWHAAPPRRVPEVQGVEIVVERDPEAALAYLDWAEVLLVGRPTPLLDGACLRHVVIPWAGLDSGLREALLERPHLRVSNNHANAPFVAEHMVALLAALAHRVREADEALRRGDWGERGAALPSRTLRGRHALLLGYGRIGRAARPMLEGFGMRLTAFRRRLDGSAPRGAGEVAEVGPDALAELLPSVDVVLCSLPATLETSGLMDRAALAALPSGALVVNVGRAAVFDEDALFEALASGALGGAALDVWYRYPAAPDDRRHTLPAHRPFWELPNVLMGPHRASEADGEEEARSADLARSLAAIARGEHPDPVDVAAGY